MSCRFVLAVIAAVGLCAAPAQAGPVAGAVAAVGGAFGAGGALAAGTLLGTVARFAITAGLSLLSQKLFAPSARNTLRVPFTGTGGTEAQETVWGGWVTGGHLVYRNTHGGNRRFLTDVIEVSDVPGVLLSRVIVDGEYAQLGTTPHPDYGLPILNDSKTNNQGAMGWVKFYDGTQTQADPMLVDKYSGDSDRPWEATAVGTGIAYVIMTYRRGARLWPQAPQVFFELEEPLAPDPRTGSQVRSRNNAVLIRRALLGYELPTGEVWGGAVPLQDVPDDNWFAAMDACDEVVGGRPRYQTGAAIRFDTRPIEVIQDFLDACSGQIAEIGGVWRIRIGEPATPVAHIDEGDVDIGQPFTYAPFRGTDETVTAIVPTYLEPESLWRPQALDAVVDTDLEQTYGIQQTVDLPLNAVSSSKQAGQLSKEYLKDNERQRLHEFTLPPEFFFLRVLDSVTLTNSEYGYNSKLFAVVATTHDIRTMTVRVRVRERDPSDYAYDGNFDFPAPATPLEPVPAPALVLEGFDAEPYTPQADGSVDWRPGVRVKWTNGIDLDSEGVTEVAIQIKHAATQDILWAGFAEDVASGQAVAVGLPSGQQVAARARPVSAVFEGIWSDWVPVTTPQVDIKVTELEQATQDKIQTAFDRTNNAISLVDGSIGELRDQYAIPTADRLDFTVPRVSDLERLSDDIFERLSEDALRLDKLNKTIVDAGVYTDPESGTVKISGIASLDNRVSAAEITVDGLSAEIQLRATVAYVDQAVSEAVLDPSQIPVLGNIESRLSAAEVNISAESARIDLATDTLTVDGDLVTMSSVTGRLDSLEDEIVFKVDTADFTDVEDRLGAAELIISTADFPAISQTVEFTRQQFYEIDEITERALADLLDRSINEEAIKKSTAIARSEIRAYVDENFDSIAVSQTQLEAEIADNRSAVLTESVARANDVSAIAQDLTILTAELSSIDSEIAGQATAISDLQTSVSEAEGDIAVTAQRVDLLETQVQDGSTGLLARVQTVETTKVDSAGAVAAVDAVVEAEYGDLAGMVTSTAAAVATADAVVSKQFLGVVAGAAGASLELVAFDGDPGTGSSITLNADDVFAPGSIATSRLVVTEFGGNLIPNGSFVSDDLRGWTDRTPGFEFTFGIVTVSGAPTRRVLGSNRLEVYPADLEITMARDIAVSEDDAFHMSYQYRRSNSSAGGTIRMRIQWYDSDGQPLISTAVSRSANSNSWQKAEASNVTPPNGAVRADVKFIRASGEGIIFATEFRLIRSRPGATIITPQSISTPLLAAGAVTADKIEAGTITADRLILDGRTVAQGPGGALFVDEVDRSELTLVAASDLAADYTAGPINLQGQGEVVAAYVELGESGPDAVWLINFYMEVTNGLFQFQTRETEDGIVGPWQNRNNFNPTGAQFKRRSRARIEPGGMENVEFRILAQGSSGSAAIREAFITARALKR